jgi:hypothetical protein
VDDSEIRRQDFSENTASDAETRSRPAKNNVSAAKDRSVINHDKGNDMRLDRPGTSRKNIVTNPLSLFVWLRDIW